MRQFYHDIETFSDVPIKTGIARYAEPGEVLLFAYALDSGPAAVWDVTSGAPVPREISEAVTDPECTWIAHNAWFERTVFDACGYRIPPIPRWHCTMAQAYAHSLPGKLETLGAVFGLEEDQRKSKDGKALIQLFTKPRPKKQKLRRATRETHPEEWARFVEYARQDVESMRIIHRKLPTWNYIGRELALWHLDQHVNTRGFAVDLELPHAAVRASDRAKVKLAEKTRELTGGEVEAATQRDKLLEYVLAAHGIDLPDMKSDTLERRLDDPELPEAVKELLRVRLSSSKTTSTKYKRFIDCTSSDGRMRGTMQFCGAARTGRFAHRLVQPGNFMRPDMKPADIDQGTQWMKDDAEDLLCDDVMRLCGNAVRGCIVAPPGKKLVAADLSNIEGRVLAWLAGEEWKIEAFRKYDTFVLDGGGNRIPDGKGDWLREGWDLYVLAYARAFNVDPSTVTKEQRQIGKVLELALGYGGGVGAFLTMAATYDLDIAAMADAAWDSIPDPVKDQAESFLHWLYEKAETKFADRAANGVDHETNLGMFEAEKLKLRFGLTEKEFIVCDSFKRLWRTAHPAIAYKRPRRDETSKQGLWEELAAAMRSALANPGKVFYVGKHLQVDTQKAWLRVRLPSGRYLSYPGARVSSSGEISYMGMSQYTRKWCRIRTYPGKSAENVTQAVARDVMTHNMPAIEEWRAA